MPIRVLPPEVASRIAAGEVIERPASVVKELVENALDAGASRITIEIHGGGIELIRVADDGCGIDPDELPLAFQRHATSKLSDDSDLTRVLTLGFRGEALPSIAAVADAEIVSRPPAQDSGAFLRTAPERGVETGSRGVPPGTSVTVRRLFERLPARRKFLRSPASEANAVAAAVTQLALARPDVRFTMTIDGRQALSTPGTGDLRDTAAAVYGLDVAEAMLEVAGAAPAGTGGQVSSLTGAGGGSVPIRVHGLAAPPHIFRQRRGYVSLYVNDRPVQNRRLTYAVEEAYQGMLMTGRRPLAVLNIDVPPDDVDVNVHPTKAEVRFCDESAVFGALQRAVRAALVEHAPIPAGVAGASLSLAPPPWTPPLWEAAVRRDATVAVGTQHAVDRRHFGAQDGPSNSHQRPDRAGAGPGGAHMPAATLPVLRVIGQFGSTYIIAEGPEGMYLLDQHAAHERVLYERFCGQREQLAPEVQSLLEPVTLDLPARQRLAVEGEAEALAAHGFEIEPFGEGSYIVRAVPRALAGGDVRETLLRLLEVLLEEDEGDRRDRVAMSLACHGAIRAGKTLAPEEMQELVRQLEETDAPHTCPHGRPTMVHMSAEMVARGFGRR